MGHQLLLEFRSTPEYYYLENLYQSLDQERDPAIWFETIKAKIAEHLAPFEMALARDQINLPFFEAASMLIQLTLLPDIFRQLEESIDSENPEQLTLAHKRKLVEQIFKEYPPFKSHAYYFDKQYAYINKYFSFIEAEKRKERSLFSYKGTIIQINDLACELPLSFPYFQERKEKELADFFWARELFIAYHVFTQNPEPFENKFLCFKALFPQSRYISTLENIKTKH